MFWRRVLVGVILAGEFLIQFRDGVSDIRIAAINRRLGTKVISVTTELNLYRVKLPPGASAPDYVATCLSGCLR